MDQSTGRRVGEPNLTAPANGRACVRHGSCALTQLYSVPTKEKQFLEAGACVSRQRPFKTIRRHWYHRIHQLCNMESLTAQCHITLLGELYEMEVKKQK